MPLLTEELKQLPADRHLTERDVRSMIAMGVGDAASEEKVNDIRAGRTNGSSADLRGQALATGTELLGNLEPLERLSEGKLTFSRPFSFDFTYVSEVNDHKGISMGSAGDKNIWVHRDAVMIKTTLPGYLSPSPENFQGMVTPRIIVYGNGDMTLVSQRKIASRYSVLNYRESAAIQRDGKLYETRVETYSGSSAPADIIRAVAREAAIAGMIPRG